MSWRRHIADLLRNLLRGEQTERELDEEVQGFFEILIERHMARGLSCEQAMRKAHVDFEGPEQIKEKVREELVGVFIETTARDIRYAWRTLRKNAGFTAVAISTLASVRTCLFLNSSSFAHRTQYFRACSPRRTM